MTISFVNPATKNPLRLDGDRFVDAVSGSDVARLVDSIPRFCETNLQEAYSWAYQWHTWTDTLSDSRSQSGDSKYNLILERTHFGEFDLERKTILECGCGGGDDTETLLRFPFSEVHAFDLSASIDRAREQLHDDRLVLSQASIFEIPYPDEAFDVVFCHRVLQHTPDPPVALRAICKKVKPGGILFAHCYQKNWFYLMNYKYKYRWLTRRMAPERVHRLLERYGPRLYAVNERMRTRNPLTTLLSLNFVPFDWVRSYGDLDRQKRIELLKLITFDALTPRYDKPMRWRRFRRTIEDEGFVIRNAMHCFDAPLHCTAVKR